LGEKVPENYFGLFIAGVCVGMVFVLSAAVFVIVKVGKRK